MKIGRDIETEFIKISVRNFDKIYKEFFFLVRAFTQLVCRTFANIQGGSN